ncbi:GAP family protein [Propionibacteriaceae bacterium Y2011]
MIAVLLGTKRAASGAWLTIGYAAGLAILFALGALGAQQIAWHPLRGNSGVFELFAGVVLLFVATVWLIWDRRRAPRPEHKSGNRFLDWLSTLGPFSCLVVGFQFAFHPENLILTFAAAGTTRQLNLLPTVLILVWFCVVGVSTVAVPTVLYVTSGESARTKLKSVRDWIDAHGAMLTVVLLYGVGALLTGLGLYNLLR